MKHYILKIIRALLILILTFGLACSADSPKKDKHYEESWESIESVNPTPDWFMDAKFGIYTHWGPTSCAFVGMDDDESLPGWHGMYMYGKNGSMQWQTGTVSSNNDGTPNTNPTSNYVHHVDHFGDPAEFG